MNVRELIEELSKCNPESEVILQSEGNNYSPLLGADNECWYIAESSYYGQVYSTDWTAEDCCLEEEEWEEIKRTTPCVVLFPNN